MRQLKEKRVVPAGIAGIQMLRMAMATKHIHVFWMSAIHADMTAFHAIAAYYRH